MNLVHYHLEVVAGVAPRVELPLPQFQMLSVLAVAVAVLLLALLELSLLELIQLQLVLVENL